MAAERSDEAQLEHFAFSVGDGVLCTVDVILLSLHLHTHHPHHIRPSVPPAAVTDAERRRFGHAYEELKRRYANLDSLLDAAHSTVSRVSSWRHEPTTLGRIHASSRLFHCVVMIQILYHFRCHMSHLHQTIGYIDCDHAAFGEWYSNGRFLSSEEKK